MNVLPRPASGFPDDPDAAPASPEGDAVQHLRQHVGHDGEVRQQPRGSGCDHVKLLFLQHWHFSASLAHFLRPWCIYLCHWCIYLCHWRIFLHHWCIFLRHWGIFVHHLCIFLHHCCIYRPTDAFICVTDTLFVSLTHFLFAIDTFFLRCWRMYLRHCCRIIISRIVCPGQVFSGQSDILE